VRRRWIDELAFSDLVALCQFLPGPASSQLGFSIGLTRAGYWGGLAAWAGFTFPSALALALVLVAEGADTGAGSRELGLLHGMKLVAVAFVAHAVSGMARSLCPDRQRASLAAAAAVILLASGSTRAQIVVLLLGGIAGFWLCRSAVPASQAAIVVPVSRRSISNVKATAHFAPSGQGTGLVIIDWFSHHPPTRRRRSQTWLHRLPGRQSPRQRPRAFRGDPAE
jgi:chromate transporter